MKTSAPVTCVSYVLFQATITSFASNAIVHARLLTFRWLELGSLPAKAWFVVVDFSFYCKSISATFQINFRALRAPEKFNIQHKPFNGRRWQAMFILMLGKACRRNLFRILIHKLKVQTQFLLMLSCVALSAPLIMKFVIKCQVYLFSPSSKMFPSERRS